MTSTTPAPARGISHLVLNVRDIETSHRFWTEVMGWEHCASLRRPSALGTDMRFYRCAPDHHHDVAIVQVPKSESLPEAGSWDMRPAGPGLNHVAITYDRDAWLRQIAHLQAKGVEFKRRVNHGMTHSVYIADPDGNGLEILYDLPHEVWQDDVEAALNYIEALPTTGPEALEDSTDYHSFAKSSV